MPTKKELELYIEVDVLTAGTAAEVVNAILESLLYQRNQIPFVYKTYRYYVNKWLEQDENLQNIEYNGSEIHSLQVQRKRQQAANTKKAISTMREVIEQTFENKLIKSLRFLFGSTIFTAKEAYTIHIPTANIATNHLHDHHRIIPANLNQTLLSLLTSENLYAIFSNNLNPTNMYLELEILENEKSSSTYNNVLQNSSIFPKEFFPLPASCRDIHLHLLHKHNPDVDYKMLNCCKEIQIFEDIINLNLNCEDEQREDFGKKNLDNYVGNTKPAWWEAEIVIHGFKDQPIKGFNIWS